MENKEILEILAPCGLNCKKCVGNLNGDIKHLSTELLEALGSFDKYAEKFAKFQPVFSNYPAFKLMLEHLSQGKCTGCREGGCSYPGCGVYSCRQEKNIDFCFECEEFPCDKTNFDPDLHKRWIEMNTKMKEIGIEAYMLESMNSQRYK